MTYQEFTNEIADIKARLFEEFDLADALDHVDTEAESRQSVIYYAQAWELVNMIREADHGLYQEAQEVLSDQFIDEYSADLNTMMTRMALCIWHIAISQALYGIRKNQ